MAVHALLKLSLYTGRMGYWKIAEQATSAVYGAMLKYPTGFGQWLSAAAFILGEPQEWQLSVSQAHLRPMPA